MPVVKFNAVVKADTQRVWQTLSQFGRISEWHPAIRSSEIEENQPDGLSGCKRRLILDNGNVLREELLILDEENQTFSYRFIESPLAVDNYVATVSLIPLTGKEETVIVWQASFEARSRDETQKMEDVITHLIMSGHNSLADYLQQQ